MLFKCVFGVLVISNYVALWQGSGSKGFDTRVAVKPSYFFLKFPGKNYDTNNERTKKNPKNSPK